MNRLAPCGITAWSWVSALGSAHSEQHGPSLNAALSRSGLESHEQLLGIPGYSGRFPGALPPLPPEHRHRDSRAARLLWECLAPLGEKIAALKARVGSDRIALVLGSSTGGIDATEAAFKFKREHGALPDSFRYLDVHPYDALLEVVAESLGLTGPSFVVSTACSSAGKAMASAQRLIHAGFADAALVGGSDALCEMTVRGFSGLGVMSDDPCQPFDENRGGISIGEGAALLLLEADSTAAIQILGTGESSDAHHATAPHPEGLGAEMAMRQCLNMAGLTPRDIDYLNAHGTGTDKNDEMEALAIARVFGADCSFSSTKSRTGHQLGTAGATEAIFCVQAIAEGAEPSSVAPTTWDPRLAVRSRGRHATSDSETTGGEVTPPSAAKPIENTLSNSFAFGGSNVCVAVGRRVSAGAVRLAAPRPCFVQGVALWTPEFADVQAWKSGAGETTDKPTAALLPARARGRASVLTRIFAELYGQLSPDDIDYQGEASVRIPSIYSSAFGERETTLKLLDQMDEEPRLSPIRFQASVHNTASGRISLETKNRAFSTALAAGQSSVAMALLEAQAWLSAHGGEILVLVADEPHDPRFHTGLEYSPMGVGLHLSADRDSGVLASLAPLRLSNHELTLPRGSTRDGVIDSLQHAPPVWGLTLVDAILSGRRGEMSVAPRWLCATDD